MRDSTDFRITRRSVLSGLALVPVAAKAQVSFVETTPPAIDEPNLDQPVLLDLAKPPVWTGFGPTPNSVTPIIQQNEIRNYKPTGPSRFSGIGRKDIAELAQKSAPTKANLPSVRGLWAQNPHTGEEIVDVFWSNATYDKGAYGRLCYLMRDWRENLTSPMDPRLLHLLWIIQHKTGYARPLIINSGYRTVRTNRNLEGAAVNSYHLRSQACDINVPGVSPHSIQEFVHSLQLGGTGYYARFTHVDTGVLRSWYG